jgi:hypothetical protein
MLIISHRGNLEGPSPDENSPSLILKAIKHFCCEIDLWVKDDTLYLGHDEPIYKIDKSFLENKKLFIHAKNIEAAIFLNKTKYHWFWHQADQITLTSKQIIWCYPGIYVPGGITVVKNKEFKLDSYGLCTDYPIELSSLI